MKQSGRVLTIFLLSSPICCSLHTHMCADLINNLSIIKSSTVSLDMVCSRQTERKVVSHSLYVLCGGVQDKATLDMESMEDGFVAKIMHLDGAKDLPVGTVRTPSHPIPFHTTPIHSKPYFLKSVSENAGRVREMK